MNKRKTIRNGGFLACTATAIVALPVFAASNGLCGPESCTLVADLAGNGAKVELFYREYGPTNKGIWFHGLDEISTSSGRGWQPVVGDYNNDGFDDLALYKSGVFFITWNVNGSFTTGASTTYSLPRGTQWGANTIPVAGNWDGMGGDDLGIYTDGTFRLFPNQNDLYDQIIISFGYLRQNSGFAFTQMPFSGPIDNDASGIDRVGIYYGGYAQYAPQTITSTYDFFDIANTAAEVDFIERPEFYARPHILEFGVDNPQFSFLMPPDLPAMEPDVCDNPEFICSHVFPQRPETEQPVIIIPGAFQ